ncbi:paraquat-inducible protein A [Agarivorans albus]
MDKRTYRACEECGLVSEVVELAPGTTVSCPRCHHHFSSLHASPIQAAVAFNLACLMFLIMSLVFPFMSFSLEGLKQEITLIDSVEMLAGFHNVALAILLFLSILMLPACFLLASLFLHLSILKPKPSDAEQVQLQRLQIAALKFISLIKPWLMVDVFLIGVLISLIKIASLAHVSMGISFWAFVVYTLLFVKSLTTLNSYWLWNLIQPVDLTKVTSSGEHAQDKHIVSCKECGLVEHSSMNQQRCRRCGSKFMSYLPEKSLQICWALLIASAVFYLPANLYPIMYTAMFGESEGSTIIGGVILLWNMGSYPISMVIFFASIMIPIAKMLALGFLFYQAGKAHPEQREKSASHLKLYRITEFIGRWSMIDVFVVAILVALVQLDGLMAIYPGPAALSFAAVVIFTMLAAMSFDSRALWRK